MAKITPTPMWNVTEEELQEELASVAPRQAVENAIGDRVRRSLRNHVSMLPPTARADLREATDDVAAEVWIGVFLAHAPSVTEVQSYMVEGASIYRDHCDASAKERR